VIFVWGGDGTVQRCIDAVAGTDAVLAILPAGTANLLATNLEIPADLTDAVLVGLHGERRRLDTGTMNGEHFAVMAGAGLDARMIAEADRGMKDRIGRAAYLCTGARSLSARRVKATIKGAGRRYFTGKVSCVLAGNVSKILGGVEAFSGALPDDGVLEFGIVTAANQLDWARTLGRVALGRAEKSPFVEVTRAKKIRVRFDRALPYELDGGDRPAAAKLRIRVHPGSIQVCVPARSSAAAIGDGTQSRHAPRRG
jgi:diacylglycerol kinase (ATP)